MCLSTFRIFNEEIVEKIGMQRKEVKQTVHAYYEFEPL